MRAHEVFLSNNVTSNVTYNATSNGTFIVSRGRTWASDLDFIYGPNNQVLEKR